MRVSHVSGVLDATTLDESFDREEGFDLERFWTAWAKAHAASRGCLEVRGMASSDVIQQLKRGLAQHIDPVHAGDADAVSQEVTLSFDSLEQARGCLLAYGNAIKVLAPKALRLSIEDFAEQICSMYRGGSPRDS